MKLGEVIATRMETRYVWSGLSFCDFYLMRRGSSWILDVCSVSKEALRLGTNYLQ